MKKIISSNNTTCFYKPAMGDGKKVAFPCAQVYVSVVVLTSDAAAASTAPHENTTADPQRFKLLLQSDTKIYGDDHRRRPCSYLPDECDGEDVLKSQVDEFTRVWSDSYVSNASGEAGTGTPQTFACFDVVSGHIDNLAVLKTQSDRRLLLTAFLVPFFGALASLLFCCEFWRRNYRHVSRLYVYNSWNAS